MADMFVISQTLTYLALERTLAICSPAAHYNYLETVLKIQVFDVVDLEKSLGMSAFSKLLSDQE